MFDFGDELTIESYRIPWLVWIQIIVMLLLMVLFYSFSLVALDLPDGSCSSSSSASASTSVSSDSQLAKKPPANFKQNTLLVSHPSQVGENRSIKGEIATVTGRRILRREEGSEKEGSGFGSASSSKDANQNCYHPCHYFRLAKLAFLKCLGLELDSSSENNSTNEQRKER